MRPLSAFAIYFVLWWVVLFAVLPWGATSPHEEGRKVAEGHAESAPTRPDLLRKFVVTTIVSAVVFGIGYWIVAYSGLTFDDIPLLPKFRTV